MREKFFYIKKQQRNVEDHYWKNSDLSEPYPLNQAKIISEVVGLAFYQMMTVRTPKTYVGKVDFGPVIISQEMDSWKSCKADSMYFNRQLEPLPSSIIGLANLELASAFLGDIDVTGWLYDNIGLHQEIMNEQNVLVITKHDAGTAIVEKEQFDHFKKYFRDSLDEFPEGTMTLSENPDLTHTYLKVFNEPSITNYNQHYNAIFSHVSPDMRIEALRKLFLISSDDIRSMVVKIGQELLLSEIKQQEITNFMSDRLTFFRMTFSKVMENNSFLQNEICSTLPSCLFKNIVEQKHILRDKEYLLERFEIQPVNEKAQDYSQSSARYFKKIPKTNSKPTNLTSEIVNYFK